MAGARESGGLRTGTDDPENGTRLSKPGGCVPLALLLYPAQRMKTDR